MIIPWGTDAPIYHRPIATVGVMAACVVLFALDPYGRHTEWRLALGDGVHPVQWVTHMFLHSGLGHLLGNLLFLWAFGIIVEGKLGMIGFLAVYLFMGVFPGATIQLFYRPQEIEYAVGASGAVFGLMAVCMIWAPRNELYCLVILSGFMRLLVFQPEIPILWFAAFFIVWEIISTGFGSLAEFPVLVGVAHSLGALGGALIALVLLKLNLVDCEGWDILSRMKHGRTGTMHKTHHRKPQRSLVDRLQKKVSNAKRTGKGGEDPELIALRTLRSHLDAGETEAALGCYRTTRRRRPTWRPPDPERIDLIKALVDAKAWEDAAGVMQAYLNESSLPSPKIRLKLAEVLIRHLDRPVAGIRILEKVSESELPPGLAEGRKKLMMIAERLKNDGVLELDDEVQVV